MFIQITQQTELRVAPVGLVMSIRGVRQAPHSQNAWLNTSNQVEFRLKGGSE